MGEKRRGAWGAFFGFVAVSCVAGVLLAAAVSPVVAVASLGVSDATSTFNGLPDYLQLQRLDQTTTFYAQSNGQEVPIATFYAQNRQDVGWNAISSYVKSGAVDTENPRFYTEGGIDLVGTLRALIEDGTGHSVQGGSSITQQYVKNVLIQRCDNDDVVNTAASQKAQDKEQKTFEQCYQDAAGVTIERKLQEMRYAVGINKRYSKNSILLSYLNIVGFGGDVYGVQAAAKYYFGVSAAQLTLPQAATLVAILNNPNYLRIDGGAVPPDNTALGNTAADGFAAAKQRRDYVLDRMYIHHSITDAQYKAAIATPVTPKITALASGCMSADANDAGFFCSYVQSIMLTSATFGSTQDQRRLKFQQGGYKVYTTLNLDLQASAQQALSHYIPSTMPQVAIGASNVSMEVGTGRIVTMVQNNQFNDQADAPVGTTAINYNTSYDTGGSDGFQTGSSFKAFSLVAWLEAGNTIDQTVDAPQSGHIFPESDFDSCSGSYGDVGWPVNNDVASEGGSMTVLRATEDSINTAFAEMGTKLNLCNISNAATALGVKAANPAPVAAGGNPWEIVPPMILGTNYIAPLRMAEAYAAIANGGRSCSPVAIDKVVSSTGKSLKVPRTTCTQAIPENVAATVTWALQHVLTDGTATSADPNDGVPIMGKTGTTDHAVDNWLVTSTSKVAQATWVGTTTGNTDMYDEYFNGYEGDNVKFPIVKSIDTALDAYYGGGVFPAPDEAMIYGANQRSPGTATATPVPTPSGTTTPNAVNNGANVSTQKGSDGAGHGGSGNVGKGGT